MNKEDKLKALDAALTQIEKAYGKGSVMKLGDSGANMNIETIPTGSLSLDIALGLGGVPKGRIIEVYGPESSGKTTVALHMVALDLSMQSTHSIRHMRRRSVLISIICISPSRTTASRRLRLPRRWCAPVRSIS